MPTSNGMDLNAPLKEQNLVKKNPNMPIFGFEGT